MNFYIGAGTLEYLRKIAENNPDEQMKILTNEEGALLLHETSGESVFKEPRKYTVLDAFGVIGDSGLAAMNYVPVTDEGRPLFEYEIKDQLKQMEARSGFLAVRVLRPLSSSQSYLVLTIWQEEEAFKSWKSSSSYLASFSPANGADPKQKIFSSAPYVKTYSINE